MVKRPAFKNRLTDSEEKRNHFKSRMAIYIKTPNMGAENSATGMYVESKKLGVIPRKQQATEISMGP